MKKFVVRMMTVWLVTASGLAWAVCDDMVAWGMPEVKSNGEIAAVQPAVMCRRMYVLEHNDDRHTAWWSAEHLIGSQQGLEGERKNAFKTDPDLPKGVAARPTDYAGSKFDQGHLAPVGDMYTDKAAMIESFYLSNMVPQLPSNNRVGWRLLENYVRKQSIKRGDLFVISGPIYQGNEVKTIGTTKVMVPSHLYKIIYDVKTNEALSFVVPNIPVKWLDMVHFISDVATVEQLANISFFPDSPEPVKDSPRIW